MAIQLSPELESRIEEQMKSGRYETAEELIELALDEMDQKRILYSVPASELERMLAESDASIARGEVYTPEQVRAHLTETRAAFRRG